MAQSAPGIITSPALSSNPRRPTCLRARPPRGRVRAKHGRAGAGAHKLAVFLENHADGAGVDAQRRRALLADHEASGRAVVGHRVDERDLPVEDPRIDDLEHRHQGSVAARTSRSVRPGPRRGLARMIPISASTEVGSARRASTRRRRRCASRRTGAEVGLVDAQHLLHGLAVRPTFIRRPFRPPPYGAWRWSAGWRKHRSR